MKLKKVVIHDGPLKQAGFTEIIDETTKIDKKSRTRYEIQEEVFDLNDSVADNSKMISMIFSILNSMYKSMPENEKEALGKKRSLIEYAFDKFDVTTTSADVQIEQNGKDFIDKLFSRQENISKIIKR